MPRAVSLFILAQNGWGSLKSGGPPATQPDDGVKVGPAPR